MAKIVVTKDVCDRCMSGKEKDAAGERVFSLDDRFYKLLLCQAHLESFDRDLAMWTQLAEEIETPSYARPHRSSVFVEARKAETRRINELREECNRKAAAEDFAARRRREIDAEEVVEAEQRIWQAIPGALKWRLTDHAQLRMDERGFTLNEVLLTATSPALMHRQPWRGPQIAIYERGDCRIVVDDASHAVITVIDRTSVLETEPPTAVSTPNPLTTEERAVSL